MKIKNLKIGTQLKLGFSAMLFLVIVLGSVSYYQSDRLHRQTETIYDHPLQIRRAIGTLNMDILQIRVLMRELPLTTNEPDIRKLLMSMDILEKESKDQIDTIFEKYLGPRADVDNILAAFITYNSARQEAIALFREGKKDEVIEQTQLNGILGVHAIKVLEAIKVIDKFARIKGDSLYAESNRVQRLLHWHLALVLGVIMLISLIIYFLLLWNIRKPIEELTLAAKRFHSGDMMARSSFRSINEIGVLSASFNTLAADIQANTELGEKIADLASLMLSEYDAKKFFQTTLNALAIHTGSQMAAIYMLNDEKKSFQYYESIGTDENARKSFEANQFEGEFGAVLASKKIQHIKNIPEHTRFEFHTVIGKFIPNEILTIPIIVDNEIVAIISLSSINSYTSQSIQLINNILVTLSARIEGIMAYHKIKNFSEKLTEQNLELETQKTRLTNQSIELTEQNTELETQKHQLNEINQLKTSFLSNMSHELRTPLNSVIALSGVLNRRLADKIPNEEYSYLEVIERNGKHLLELINNILDISRIEAGREEIDITKIDANELVLEVVRMIEPQAKQKNIKLIYNAADSDLYIASDYRKCMHILQNLIANAVKFTEIGSVTISTNSVDNKVQFKVTDTGIGIASNNLSHIFDEFRQADGSTSRKYGGTGLGLAIAQKYAKILGGNITVVSEVDKGTEFTFNLPMNSDIEGDVNEIKPFNENLIAPKQTDRSSMQKIVLLVEDSNPAIIQIKDILEDDDYKILIASDGREALEVLKITTPDAIILDLMMPGIDGFELLKTIREVESTALIPVLILTAKHITSEELKFLKRNNIHQIIQKGDIHRDDLLNEVRRMVIKVTSIKDEFVKTIEPKGKPLIMIVEDNPDNMLTAKALLETDYEVIEAIDGIQSIKLATLHKPRLILMDIELPGMNGIEAFHAIRKDMHLHDIPIIALTASAMKSDNESILAHGFDAFLAKPIEEKVFFKTINEILYGK